MNGSYCLDSTLRHVRVRLHAAKTAPGCFATSIEAIFVFLWGLTALGAYWVALIAPKSVESRPRALLGCLD